MIESLQWDHEIKVHRFIDDSMVVALSKISGKCFVMLVYNSATFSY